MEPTVKSEDPLKWGGVIEWTFDTDVVKLHYNPRFVAFWERQNNMRQPYSLVGEQRPDFILEYRDTWLILDAKYRSTRVNVLDAFSSAFSYLTALKIPHLEKEPAGCFLLIPKKLSESRLWFSRSFRAENGFGLFVVAWCSEWMDHVLEISQWPIRAILFINRIMGIRHSFS